MDDPSHGDIEGLEEFTDAGAAVARITEIYDQGAETIRKAFKTVAGGGDVRPDQVAGARYPYVGISIGPDEMYTDSRVAYGAIADPGVYGTTLTRPNLFADYYRSQIDHLLKNHGVPVVVGLSTEPIALPFIVEDSTAQVTPAQLQKMQSVFSFPNLFTIDDAIANGTYTPPPGAPKPLSLFTAPRVDYSLNRLSHYTSTSVDHFQGFVLFTNYQRYVDEFVDHGLEAVASGDEYTAFVEPGEVITRNPRLSGGGSSGTAPQHLPQMPAYHLVREDKLGVTLVNIGVGPSNAKTATDHIAVLRPHAWLMIGHCAGLRRSQRLGDYVLAHAYVREDRVLYQDLPLWAPIPALAEIQVALQDAVAQVTGLHGNDLKTRMRTGTVASTDNRNWELRYDELFRRLNQARTIAVDMESATVAANGFRFRVPYGTLLCVSDKPAHGEIKMRSMANVMYRESISQHLKIALEAVRILRDGGAGQVHSRKLRSFDEPAFR
ncbi:MAG: AMP nucleosidase [Proteobacteria bacterium]|nr:AMP nucleosidase [Pseudomonadota bacterium]